MQSLNANAPKWYLHFRFFWLNGLGHEIEINKVESSRPKLGKGQVYKFSELSDLKKKLKFILVYWKNTPIAYVYPPNFSIITNYT